MSYEEPMSHDVFDKLTSCDPTLAWELCRNYVGYQLLGQSPVTVPFLDEAYHFLPFGVITKNTEGGIGARLRRTKTSYALIGSLANLAAPHVDKKYLKQKPEKVLDYTFNDKYVYRATGIRNGVKKAVKIKINGTECYDVSVSLELGKLMLDKRIPELSNVKKIFIIFEVFYAKSITVSVTIGEQVPDSLYMDTTNRKFQHDRQIPIGFNAQKFPLMDNGIVGFLEKSSLEGLRDGKWTRTPRLSSDPLPEVPGTSRRWNPTAPLAVKRNPNDVLPGLPGNRRNDPLPNPPSDSDSSD